ncbi:MAG TPA: hypothetical protein PKD61_15995, partial [Polyangiaceae bacterium]|nr:hypothetical protein [Polyangiaceae bacterium]
MSLKTRTLARAVVITLAASALPACGGAGENQPPVEHGNPPPPPEEPVEPVEPPPPPEGETPIPTNPPGP